MSIFCNGNEYPNPNTVPMPVLERTFWRRKLPRSTRFYLEGVSRELMLNKPDNYLEHAADFFEDLLDHRDGELSKLPKVSYLDKLMRKLGIPKTCPPPKQPPPPPPVVNPVRCTRCGRWLNPKAQQPSGEEEGASNVTTHMEGDEKCKVIALPPKSEDAFGCHVSHVTRGTVKEEDSLNSRSLSFLVDY